jgi:flavin-dependent thymidylate synthase
MRVVQNSVELVGCFGSDESHASAAWTSTSQELTEEKKARIPALLKTLADNGHGTPWEHSALTFRIRADVATHIQCLKHRHLSINSQSQRYKELREDRLYLPTDWPDVLVDVYAEHARTAFQLYHRTVADLVARGYTRARAKESARYCLPYGTQIEWVVTANFRSLVHFLGLRYSEHAQLEIREIAREMLRLVSWTGQFNESLRAFGYTEFLKESA